MKKTHRETNFRRTWGQMLIIKKKKIPAGAAKVDDFGDHRGPCPM